jgi:hypothetical protein
MNASILALEKPPMKKTSEEKLNKGKSLNFKGFKK